MKINTNRTKLETKDRLGPRSVYSPQDQAFRQRKNPQRNYPLLSQEILTFLRAKKSQRELSQLLGYSYNQVGKWESGATKLKWTDFLKLCETLNIPMQVHMSNYLGKNTEKIDLKKMAYHLLNSHGLLDLNNKRICNKLHKWTQAKTPFYFADFLELLDSNPSSLFAWLMFFVDGSQLPTIKKSFEHFQTCMDAVADDPILIYVNAALHLQSYQDLLEHNEILLAQHACVQVAQLREALSVLRSLGIIFYDGKKYYPCPFDFSFSNLRHKNLRKFHKYSTLLAGLGYPLAPTPLEKYKNANASVSSIRVNAISESAAEKISVLVNKFHNEAADVISNDTEPKQNVQIIVFHSFASTLLDPNKNLEVLNLSDNPRLPK
ncbi:MAG: helix-turn-helix transcriptional regulator [Bdellovibrionaceae bacterium]|nr:helix-turn-helix transcriptional regulator [Pseudobdellovibrionaceae bacterium]